MLTRKQAKDSVCPYSYGGNYPRVCAANECPKWKDLGCREINDAIYGFPESADESSRVYINKVKAACCEKRGIASCEECEDIWGACR